MPTIDNHIVPQFYLKQWENDKHLVNAYDFVHDKFINTGTGGIGYMKYTYPQELEDAFAKIESEISLTYPSIINKLENAQWKQSIIRRIPLLTEDEEFTLFKFLFLQRYRTISGRLNLSDTAYSGPLGILPAIQYAEENNGKLLEFIRNLNKEYIYSELKNCYWLLFRIPRFYHFWTSSNPVHYGVLNELYCPTNSMHHDYDKCDSMLLTLSPRFKLCITYNNFDLRIPTEFLTIIPLDTSKAINAAWKRDPFKVVQAMNFALFNGYELQSSHILSDGNEIDPRKSWFYIVAKKFFPEDKKILDSLGIEGFRKSNFEKTIDTLGEV